MRSRVVRVPFPILDHETARAFELWWRRAVIQPGSHVVVDLAGVRMVGAAGLTSLEQFEAQVLADGGTFTTAHASPIVERVFATFGADRRWTGAGEKQTGTA